MMQMLRAIFQPTEFTGKHMLAILVAFFGVIITVNLVMARFAITSWSGLVVPNTYVASQQFNGKAEEARAISALGYEVDLGANADGLQITLTDRDGRVARADEVTASLRRPVGTHEDRELVFNANPEGIYVADGRLAEGEWIAHVTAVKDGQAIYHKARRFHVEADGSVLK
ncbi:FixH family protein [Hoeflea sp.]|jgi:nitrogen fixation protein FixH|uniref:FixH family protein n=1 Tax=Hoeflea sp. TaxID=1940281 RepID=UPI002AFEA064|nr:FixH family protein [Hoeflea sp.]